MRPAWFHRPLTAGMSGPDVEAVQALLYCHPTGVLDEATQAVLRGFQGVCGIPVTGEVDEATAARIGPRNRQLALLPPLWFGVNDTAAVTRILGAADPDTLKRFQSAHNLKPTGVVDADTAVALGD